MENKVVKVKATCVPNGQKTQFSTTSVWPKIWINENIDTRNKIEGNKLDTPVDFEKFLMEIWTEKTLIQQNG